MHLMTASSQIIPPDQPTLDMDALNAAPCPMFDRLTRLATNAFRMPYAAVSLTDHTCQWLKSRIGPIPLMIPRYDTPCTRVAETRRHLAIPDLLAHPTWRNGLLAAHGVRFYAGAPLLTPEGHAIGAFCIMSPNPHEATPDEMALLHDTAALVMAQVELRHAGGRTDPVTRLPTRAQFFEELEEIGRRQAGHPRLLAVLDLARPDELAHMLRAVGSAALDDLVRRDAQRLRIALLQQPVCPGTRLYHIAPTQFALLGRVDMEHEPFSRMLERDLLEGTLGGGALFSTTCTAGLAVITPGHAPPAELLRRAQSALDAARNGRSPLGIYNPAQEDTSRRAMAILSDFAAALEERDGVESGANPDGRDGLRLVFQPRLELTTGRVLGVEALLRWTHPVLGEIGPAEFVPLIEKTTLVRPMMRWVLDRALAQARLWRSEGLNLQLSVNVAPMNLGEPDFAAHVIAAVGASGLLPTTLELEITETSQLADNALALQQLHTLSAAGIRIAIDDFGTGYSSLSYLQRLPADIVKIDRSFIQDLGSAGAEDVRRHTLVAGMIRLSHQLGYRVVAEGIESQVAADLLHALACDEVQGYHYARPMAGTLFLSWHNRRPAADDAAPGNSGCCQPA